MMSANGAAILIEQPGELCASASFFLTPPRVRIFRKSTIMRSPNGPHIQEAPDAVFERLAQFLGIVLFARFEQLAAAERTRRKQERQPGDESSDDEIVYPWPLAPCWPSKWNAFITITSSIVFGCGGNVKIRLLVLLCFALGL